MMSTEPELRQMLTKGLRPYVPEQVIPVLVDWMMTYKIHLTLTPQRSSKLGDYRHPFGNKGHRISVNKNLNPYSFLITFVHEVAHLKCWLQHRNAVPAHGSEWKQLFADLLRPFIEQAVFPTDVNKALRTYIVSPGASSCSDEQLLRALHHYDTVKLPRLEDLLEETLFRTINGRLFKKGAIIRKRIRCIEVETRRVFLFHPLAEVVPDEHYSEWCRKHK